MGVNTMCTKTKGINTEMSPSCVLTLKLHLCSQSHWICVWQSMLELFWRSPSLPSPTSRWTEIILPYPACCVSSWSVMQHCFDPVMCAEPSLTVDSTPYTEESSGMPAWWLHQNWHKLLQHNHSFKTALTLSLQHHLLMLFSSKSCLKRC